MQLRAATLLAAIGFFLLSNPTSINGHYQDTQAYYQGWHRFRPPPPRRAVDVMADVLNDIGTRVLQQYVEAGNVAFSPAGLGFILAALYEGSAGRSKQQIIECLGLPRDRMIVRIGMRDIYMRLRTYLNPDGFLGGLNLNRENTTLRPEYEDILTYYGFNLTMDLSNFTDNAANFGLKSSKTTTMSPGSTMMPMDMTMPPTTVDPNSVNGVAAGGMSTMPPSTTIDTSVVTVTTTQATTQPTTEAPTTTTTTQPAPASIQAATTMATTLPPTTTTQRPTTTTMPTTRLTTTLAPIIASTLPPTTTTLPPPTTTTTMSTPETTTEERFEFLEDIATVVPPTDPPETRKRRSSDGYFSNFPDDGLWMQDLDIWADQPALPTNLRDATDLHFLVNGCEPATVPAATYTAVLPFGYFPTLKAAALEFPLDNPRYNVLLMLPTARTETGRLARELTTQSLRMLRQHLQPTWVRATIPSFMLRGFVTLTSYLQRLGIRDVFEPRLADLSPMTPDLGVYARDVQQSIAVNIRNFIKDNMSNGNNSTNGAAGNGTASSNGSANGNGNGNGNGMMGNNNVNGNLRNPLRLETPQLNPPRRETFRFLRPGNSLSERAGLVSFTAEHPFLYFIIDNETSVSLIAGRIDDPLNSRIL